MKHLQHLADHGSTSNLDEHNMIQTDTVVAIQEGKAALNFVRLDHALEQVFDGELLTLPRQIIRNGQDGTQVIGGMSP